MSPGVTDTAVVRRHLFALDRALEHLATHASTSATAYAQDLDQQWLVERGLLICAQNVIDIATHLCAARGRDTPDYASSIQGLGELGIVPRDFAARLRPLAGFRNVLVHGYLTVDPLRVHDVLVNHLDDMRQFARQVDAFLAADG